MSKWLLLMCTGCLIIIAVSSSPILNGESNTKDEQVARQSNEVTNVAAAQPAVAAAPPAPASPASSNSEDDDDDDDDDVDLGLTDDDDDDDDDEEEGDAASDDDDDDDDDYDFERILDDILGGGDDEEEEEEEEAASDAVSAAPQAAVSSTAAPAAPIQGLAASPTEEVAEQNIEQAAVTNDEEDQVAEENNPHTVTLITNGQPDDVDEAQEQVLNTNNLGAAATQTVSSAPANQAASANQTPAVASDDDDDEDEDEEDEDEENVLGDDDEEDEDDEEDDEARKARSMQGKAIPVPSAYIAKYNNYIDTIFERINNVLKKNYDPVNVRLQTAPSQKKKPGSAKHSSKYKRRKPARPSSRDNESNNSTSTVTGATQDEAQHRSARVQGRSNRRIQKRKSQNKATNAPKPSKKIIRAKAVLYGLSSLRRDGDVLVNVMNTHTTVKTRFLVGPLTLKVEKEFGRGAKKEMRSATATTAEMFGKLNLKVVHGGDTALSSIKVMQPKQMRVETLDDHDKTKEFLWKRSSNLAHLVSQKLSNAAKSFMKPKPVTATAAQNQTVTH